MRIRCDRLPCVSRGTLDQGTIDGAVVSTKFRFPVSARSRRRGRHRASLGLPLAGTDGVPRGPQRPGGTTGPLQPQAPRRRRRHRLPLLPSVGRAVRVRGHSAALDLYDLPLAVVHASAGAGAVARGVPQRRPVALEAPVQAARLRLLQPRHPHSQGRRLRELPRRRRQDAADGTGEEPDDAVVPALPPRSRAIPAPARRGVQPALARAGPARPRREAGAEIPHRYEPHDGLFAMSPVKPTLTGMQAAFDPDAAREKLAATRGPVYWRSLEELADSEGFRRWLRQQNPRLGEALLMDRRGFLKLLGASLALAGLAACSHPPQTEIVPYVHKPLGQVDGLPRYFATVLTREGYAQGVLVADHQGRPTKAEGNPQHPASLGGTDIFAQAAILQLWDPDRSQSIRYRGITSTWNDFVAKALAMSARFDKNGGNGLHVLTGPVTSPTLAAQLDTLARRFPNSRWHVHRPGGRNAYDGAQLAFGKPLSTRLHMDRARVIVALDADPLSDPAAGTRYGHDYAATRAVDRNGGAMSRLYAIEPTPSLTGLMADHRLPLAFPEVGEFARQLAGKIGVGASAGAAPAMREQARWLDAVAADLHANRGESLVLVGASQPPWLHALGHAMNAALGNVGKTIDYSAPVESLPANDEGLAGLVSAMRSGKVDTLLALEVNPVYDAPADLEFAHASKRVPHLLHLGLYLDETGEVAEWHVPQAHPLEAWSDARAFDGTASIAQPLIAPLYDGKSAHEVLAAFTGEGLFESHALVRRQWQTALPDDKSWNDALQAGVVPNTALSAVTTSRLNLPSQNGGAVIPAKAGLRRQDAEASGVRRDDEQRLELLLRPDPTIGDGRWANNG